MKNYPYYPFRLLLLVVCGILLITGIACSQTLQQQADQYITDLVKKGKFSGAVLIAKQGKVLLSKGYGYANSESKKTNTPHTIFRIGSLTKPFTSVLVLQLVEQSRIDLDKPLSTYFPSEQTTETKLSQITVRQLLQQTTGLADYTETQLSCTALDQHPIQPKNFLTCLPELSLEFAPGSRFSYSNTNYYLLGLLLEQITGQTFQQLLYDKILHPLNMKRTGYLPSELQSSQSQDFAQGYTLREGKVVPTQIEDIGRAYAAGGLYSTVEDLYLFDQALRNETLLKKVTIQQVFAENKAVQPSYYGFGWYVSQSTAYQDYRTFHEGGIDGFSACIDRYLTNGLCVIILSNLEFTESRVDLTEPIIDLVFKTSISKK
ncbi:serine hydrolase domain-containing protein [Xanthocytophaga agilis]|uniref:Serine hydrolase domain-containing protein n=1 Tax=Xanthocytophaga agilis TaxID=3048010 RepID=A0AAE3UJ55_9BACT|nr:serine hydrolase domain-containing protein [Xanthocytophaga agilis]MDJ1506341.1 serine hydrolase domain-containing protein [Xanthocytophaga agilis]